MDTLLPVRPRRDSRATSRLTGLLRLPPETYLRVRERLGLLAATTVLLFGVALVLNQVANTHDPVAGYAAANRASNATGFLSSLVLLGLCRWRAVGHGAVLVAGTVWEWILCLHMGSILIWFTMNGYGHAPPLTWAVPIMLGFPLVIPMPTRFNLVVSLVAASMPVAGAAVMQAWGAIPELTRADWYHLALNHYVALPLPVLVSHVMYHMALEVHEARILGRYRLEEMIGRGGMGEVWRATHRFLARPAAVKLVRTDLVTNLGPEGHERALARFTREARATAALTSPHSVNLYDFGFSDDGRAYYVMELLQGVDLETLVETWGPMPAERVVHVVWQACESLAEAHAAGLVHRDIKPANLFLGRKGLRLDQVSVLDFGLVALRPEQGAADTRLTREDSVGGTPAYMAPEMVRGRPVDGRADLYSLGCVAFFLLTGRTVFEAPSALMMLMKHSNEPPGRPSASGEIDACPALEDLVMDLLAKHPDDRPESAREVQRRLAACGLDRWTEDEADQWWDMHRPDVSRRRQPNPNAGERDPATP